MPLTALSSTSMEFDWKGSYLKLFHLLGFMPREHFRVYICDTDQRSDSLCRALIISRDHVCLNAHSSQSLHYHRRLGLSRMLVLVHWW